MLTRLNSNIERMDKRVISRKYNLSRSDFIPVYIWTAVIPRCHFGLQKNDSNSNDRVHFGQVLEETKARVDSSLRDDFNTSSAMRDVLHLVSVTNSFLFPDSVNISQVKDGFDERNRDDTCGSDNADHGGISQSKSRRIDGIVEQTLQRFETNIAEGTVHKLTENIGTLSSRLSDFSKCFPVSRYEIAAVRNYIVGLMSLFGMNYSTGQVRNSLVLDIV